MPEAIVPVEKYPSLELNECPYPFFDRVREEAPVYRDPDTGVYLVFRHEDIAFALRNHELFVGVNGHFSYGGVAMISATEPPEHKAVRDLAFRSFTPARLRSYEALVREQTELLIDAFAARGEVELVDEFAVPLPGRVICHLLGLPTEGDVFEAILDDLSLRGPERSRGPAAAQIRGASEDLSWIHDLMREEILARHETPRDDVLGELTARQIGQDGELNVPLLVTIAAELLAGGILTTGQMITSGMVMLLHHPGQLDRVRADHALIPGLLEETLRAESPVQFQPRIATRDVELGGVRIPAGADVLLVFASGNRDSRRFPHANEFDVGRPRDELKDHFGFGYGIHFCLGAPLARMEGRIAFERLFGRLPNLRAAPGKNDFRHIDRAHFRAFRRVHLEFDPVEAGR